MIEPGDEVKDIMTGFKGIVVATHHYIYGCTRVSVQAKMKKGEFADAQAFDEPQLKILKKRKFVAKEPKKWNDSGGPTKFADRGKPYGR